MSRTVPPSALLHALGCIAILSLSGCNSLLFYDDRCGPEGRDVTTAARILTPQADSIGLVSLSIGETRREEGSRSVWWLILSEVLRGHLQEARVVPSEDTSGLLLSLSGAPGYGDIIMEGELTPYSGPAEFNELFFRASHERLAVLLQTDLPDRPSIVLPLQIEQFNDWGRAHCS
jgi:hypothetical protein